MSRVKRLCEWTRAWAMFGVSRESLGCRRVRAPKSGAVKSICTYYNGSLITRVTFNKPTPKNKALGEYQRILERAGIEYMGYDSFLIERYSVEDLARELRGSGDYLFESETTPETIEIRYEVETVKRI